MTLLSFEVLNELVQKRIAQLSTEYTEIQNKRDMRTATMQDVLRATQIRSIQVGMIETLQAARALCEYETGKLPEMYPQPTQRIYYKSDSETLNKFMESSGWTIVDSEADTEK